MCQSVPSEKSFGAAVASSVHTPVITDGLTLFISWGSMLAEKSREIWDEKKRMGRDFLAARNVHVNIVQGISSPSRDVDMLVECR